MRCLKNIHIYFQVCICVCVCCQINYLIWFDLVIKVICNRWHNKTLLDLPETGFYSDKLSFTDMPMNQSFEQSGGDIQSGEYETMEKSPPSDVASPGQGLSIPNPAFEEGPVAGMNNRRVTKQERVCNTRCMVIVVIIYGILLAVIIALLCFVMIQIFQLKANQGKWK